MPATEPSLTLVELFGAPGAGKSTLANAVSARVETRTRHQLSAEWHSLPALQKASHIAAGFAKADALISAARLAFGCRVRNRSSLALLSRLIAKSHWLRSQRGLVLLDQGLLQDLWSVLYMAGCTEPDAANLSPLLRSLYPRSNTQIIFVDVDPDTAFQRVTGRSGGHSRLDSLPEEELRKSVERTAQLPRAIIRAATTAGLKVVSLDGSNQIDALAEDVLSLLPSKSARSRAASA